jgi:hypothetical protein
MGLAATYPADVLAAFVSRLERQLIPVPNADLARLLAELNHDDYLVRERATAALLHAGESVRPQLERALAESSAAESRSRLRLLVARAGRAPRFSPGDILRIRRLIGVAEPQSTDEARRLLQLIANEFPEKSLAREAREALRRRG